VFDNIYLSLKIKHARLLLKMFVNTIAQKVKPHSVFLLSISFDNYYCLIFIKTKTVGTENNRYIFFFVELVVSSTVTLVCYKILFYIKYFI
jgi:hypothetical protein